MGNPGSWLNISVVRDLTPPSVAFNTTNGGYFGVNSSVQVEIEEDSGLRASIYSLHAVNHSQFVLVQNVSEYIMSGSSNLPTWFWNVSQIELRVNATSVSGHNVVVSMFFIPDRISLDVRLPTNLVVNRSGSYTSNFTEFYVQPSTDVDDICIRVGANWTDASSASCVEIQNSKLSIHRNSGTYSIFINSTDHAGNKGFNQYSFNHHTSSPSLYFSPPGTVSPGSSHSYNITTPVGYSVAVKWGNISLVSNQNTLVMPTSGGIQDLRITVSDDLGMVTVQNFSVRIDDGAPSVNILASAFANVHIGTNTSVSLSVFDEYSNLASVRITVNASTLECSKNLSTFGSALNLTDTLTGIMNSTACNSMPYINQQLLVSLVAVDVHGNSNTTHITWRYHGSTKQPAWNATSTFQTFSTTWASNQSRFTCNGAPSTISPTYAINWSGQTASLLSNEAQDLTGSGLLTCIVSDLFGNTNSSVMNITLDVSSPEVDLQWPSMSSTPYVRVNTGFFRVITYENQTSVSRLHIVSHSLFARVLSKPTAPSRPAQTQV